MPVADRLPPLQVDRGHRAPPRPARITPASTLIDPPSCPNPNLQWWLRAPHARTAAVVSRGAGRAQGGAGCPARAWRSGASLRPPRPCPRLRRRAVLVAMRLRARCGARRWWGPVGSVRGVSGWVGVSRGWFCFGGVSGWRGVGRAVVASAGRVGVVVWRAALARSGVSAVVFRGGGRRRVLVARRRCRLRGGLGRLGRVSAGGSAVRWRGVGCLRAGGCPAVAPAGRSRRVARRVGLGAGGLGRWGFGLWRGGAAAALPLRVTSVAGCRWRGGCWLQRQFSHW